MTCPICGNALQNVECETCAALARSVDHAIRPAIDRALERDHSLCGAEPCSDCR